MPRILIADDSEHGRASLKALLLLRDGWTVCGEAVNGRQAVLMAADLKPDVIILDFSMPMLDGLQAAKEILVATPNVPIILFTFHRTNQLDVEAERAGIRKVISKNDPLKALLGAVEASLDGGHAPVGPLAIPVEAKVEPTIAPAEKSKSPIAVALAAAPAEAVGPLAVPTEPPAQPLVTASDNSIEPPANASAPEKPPEVTPSPRPSACKKCVT
jgi:DNA-binding NarL/FixJ family response regulator